MARPYPNDYKRLKRIDAAGTARAINFACFHDQPFLSSPRACAWLAEAVVRALPEHECDLWAYCFMPTHAHLLVFPRGDEPDIAAFLESVKKSVARRALNWVRAEAPAFLPRMRDEQPNGRVSHRFWQRGGGYDRNLWTPRAVWDMIGYIHANPVEAGLCAAPSDWPWSSAAFFETRAPGVLPVTLDRCPAKPR